MNPDEILSLLEHIGELLTPAATAAWEIAVRQATGLAITHAFGAVVGLIVIGLSAWGLKKLGDDDLGVLPLLGLIAGVAIFLVCATQAILRFVNPPWYAIQLLGGLVK